MITLEMLCLRVERVTPAELEDWIARAWIRPDGEPGRYVFQPIDEARVRLILELRHDLRIDDEALPLVLSLLDQLYAERRHISRMRDAIARGNAISLRETIGRILDETTPES